MVRLALGFIAVFLSSCSNSALLSHSPAPEIKAVRDSSFAEITCAIEYKDAVIQLYTSTSIKFLEFYLDKIVVSTSKGDVSRWIANTQTCDTIGSLSWGDGYFFGDDLTEEDLSEGELTLKGSDENSTYIYFYDGTKIDNINNGSLSPNFKFKPAISEKDGKVLVNLVLSHRWAQQLHTRILNKPSEEPGLCDTDRNGKKRCEWAPYFGELTKQPIE